jgi:predicted transcriptional regulator
MSLKIINIIIPDEAVIREIETFSPEENMLMLKIGSNCILEGRKAVAGLTQKEIYQKIKDESKDEVKRLELEIIVEKESSKKLEERISKIYETQIEQMKKQMEKMSQQISIYESENKDILQKEISKAREKFDLLLQEKDNQNKLNRE